MISKSRHEASLLIVSNVRHKSNWVEGVIKTNLKAFLENSRQAHEQVERFAKDYLSVVKSLTSVKITSITYC